MRSFGWFCARVSQVCHADGTACETKKRLRVSAGFSEQAPRSFVHSFGTCTCKGPALSGVEASTLKTSDPPATLTIFIDFLPAGLPQTIKRSRRIENWRDYRLPLSKG